MMKKNEKSIFILLTLALVIFFLLKFFQFYNIFVLSLYEIYLCFTIFFSLKIFLTKNIKLQNPDIILILCILDFFCLYRNTFLLLFSFSICSGGFHSK
mgnify:CR=1 FL=1